MSFTRRSSRKRFRAPTYRPSFASVTSIASDPPLNASNDSDNDVDMNIGDDTYDGNVFGFYV